MSEISYQSLGKQNAPKNEIIALFKHTFTDSEGEAEGTVIADLVTDLLTTTDEKDLKIFVAKKDEVLVSCIIFTPLGFETGELGYLLSPVATLTDFQKQGIGKGLINHALQSLKAESIDLVFTYGDPNFYGKVGFLPVTESLFQAPHPLSFPHGWLAQSLEKKELTAINGKSFCVAGLNNPTFW